MMIRFIFTITIISGTSQAQQDSQLEKWQITRCPQAHKFRTIANRVIFESILFKISFNFIKYKLKRSSPTYLLELTRATDWQLVDSRRRRKKEAQCSNKSSPQEYLNQIKDGERELGGELEIRLKHFFICQQGIVLLCSILCVRGGGWMWCPPHQSVYY